MRPKNVPEQSGRGAFPDCKVVQDERCRLDQDRVFARRGLQNLGPRLPTIDLMVCLKNHCVTVKINFALQNHQVVPMFFTVIPGWPTGTDLKAPDPSSRFGSDPSTLRV